MGERKEDAREMKTNVKQRSHSPRRALGEDVLVLEAGSKHAKLPQENHQQSLPVSKNKRFSSPSVFRPVRGEITQIYAHSHV